MSESRETDTEPKVLLVDDDDSVLRSMVRTLRAHGVDDLLVCNDSRRVAELLETERVALVLLDLVMPRLGGEEVLIHVAEHHPEVPVILVTAETDVVTAVRCIKRGAIDYLIKPVDSDRLVTAVRRTLEQGALQYEAAQLREQFLSPQPGASDAFRAIITQDPGMHRLFAYLEAVSRGSQPVLVTGETGTGKELVAQALHVASGRSGAFVAVNVAGLDDTQFSDTLFGHRAGAFTGAVDARAGMIEQAEGGTLFLDEIGDLADSSQVKLLRLLQEREYYPLGSDMPQPLRARVVAATHQDPETLRTDLYYRLRLYRAEVPPLRDRLGDLPLLIDRFLTAAADDLQRPKPRIEPDLVFALENHAFPGNVRELQALVFDAVARTVGDTVSTELMLAPLGLAPVAKAQNSGPMVFPHPLPELREIEMAAIEEALRRADGNQSAAARALGISRNKLARQLGREQADLGD